MELKKIKSVAIALGFLIAICVIQCTPKTQIVKQDDEAVLKRRAQEYWSYKIKGEWDKSYIYETPQYREKVSLVKYINQWGRFPMKWEEFDIMEIWTSGEEGYVKLNARYRYILPQTNKALFEKVVEEKWIKNDGQWYCAPPTVMQ